MTHLMFQLPWFRDKSCICWSRCTFPVDHVLPMLFLLGLQILRYTPFLQSYSFSSKLVFGTTIPQSFDNLFLESSTHFKIVCWFGAIVVFSTVLIEYWAFVVFSSLSISIKCSVRSGSFIKFTFFTFGYSSTELFLKKGFPKLILLV